MSPDISKRSFEDAGPLRMWKESIGSAIGAVDASTKGKVVAIADSNRIRNRTIAYCADTVVDDVNQALHAIRALLRGTTDIVVLKRNGTEEPFSRNKLMESIRSACRQARRDDIIVPALLMPRLGEELARRVRARAVDRKIGTRDIERAALSALEDLERDPLQAPAVTGVRTAWQRHIDGKRSNPQVSAANVGRSQTLTRLAVPVHSAKSHGTIWGKSIRSIDDISSPDTRRVFDALTTVEGIAEVVIRAREKGPSQVTTAAAVQASRTPHVLEGKLYDHGEKGHLQLFQIKVHDERRKAIIEAAVKSALEEAGLWKAG